MILNLVMFEQRVSGLLFVLNFAEKTCVEFHV